MNIVVTSLDRGDLIKKAFNKRSVNLFLYQLGKSKKNEMVINKKIIENESDYINGFNGFIDQNNIEYALSTVGYDNLVLVDCQLKNIIKNKKIEFLAQDLETTILCNNKFLTKLLCDSQKINTIKGKIIYNSNELKNALKLFINREVVIKKLNTWAGIGMIFENSRELILNLDTLNIEFPCLIEPFVEAIELSINIFTYKDETIIYPPIFKGKTSIKERHSLNKIRSSVYPFEKKFLNQIYSIGKKIAKIFNNNGWMEIELLLCDNKINVMEINNRFSGTTRISYMTTGVNPYEISLDALLDKKISSKILNAKFPVVEFPFYDEINILETEDIYVYYSSTSKERLGTVTAKLTENSIPILQKIFFSNKEVQKFLTNYIEMNIR